MYKFRPLRKNKDIIKAIAIKDTPKSNYKEYKSKALSDKELENILHSMPWFVGVFDELEFKKAPLIIYDHLLHHSIAGFIILYQFHFVAVIFNLKEYTLEYYDSFGKPPSRDTENMLLRLVKMINSKYLLKYKYNEIPNQNAHTNNCGLFAMHFLINRLVNHETFIEATNYDTRKGEKRVRKIGSILHNFGYI